VVAFDPSQNGAASLVYSTFLGGNGSNSGGYCPSQPGDVIDGVAVDTKSNAYLTGATCSSDFPTTAGAFQSIDPTPGSCTQPTLNAFLSKLNSTGARLGYSTFLGGSSCNENSVGYAVAVDSAENAFVTGNTFNAAGSGLLFSTLLGAGGGALGYAIHADNYGNLYVAGQASSSSYLPTTAHALQTTFGGGATDAFALRIALAQADLAVTNSAPATILRGKDMTYTIKVQNNGPDTAYAITLADSVPEGTLFASAATTSGSCTSPAAGATSGRVVCTASSLADAATFTVSMTVKVYAQSGDTLTDTAAVSSLVYDTVPANNTAKATTTVN